MIVAHPYHNDADHDGRAPDHPAGRFVGLFCIAHAHQYADTLTENQDG